MTTLLGFNKWTAIPIFWRSCSDAPALSWLRSNCHTRSKADPYHGACRRVSSSAGGAYKGRAFASARALINLEQAS